MQFEVEQKFRVDGFVDVDRQLGSLTSEFAAASEQVGEQASEDAGLPDQQCVIAGWGQYRPVVAGKSADAKAKNRRVEIVVHRPKE